MFTVEMCTEACWKISAPNVFNGAYVGYAASCGLGEYYLFTSQESAQRVCDALNQADIIYFD